ncbi:MAG: hypothetical protein GYA33_02810, partial [Thermogutta sp.]|nr:hypothetical protein [Thermogutta sp.]
LAAAVQSLADANWSAAVEHQDRAVETLEQLLTRLRRASGLLEGNEPAQRNAVLEKLAARQEELRRRTELEAADPATANRLVEEQLGIRKDLERISANLADAARSPLERAADAAGRAAEQLFQENAAEATQYQDQVLANIAEALSQTAGDTAGETPQSAAASQRDPIADLEETAEALRLAREKQNQASESARASRISEAAELERQIASDVASIPEGRELPEHVRSAVEEAAQKVGAAAETLSRPDPESASRPAVETASADPAGQREPGDASQGRTAPSSKADPSSKSDDGVASPAAAAQSSGAAPDPSAAAAATRSAEQALEKALSVVETELADLTRQRAASEVVAAAREAFRTAANGSDSAPWFEQARQSAQKLAELTSRQLQEARNAAEAVEGHLNADSIASSEALKRLEEARSGLPEAAAENVQEAIRRREEAARQQLAQSRQAARSLVAKAIPVTPQATEALHRAESAAASGMRPESASAVAAQEASRANFLDAAAAIAAREAQLEQALEAANRLPSLLTPETMTAQAAHPNAANDTTPAAEVEPVSAALQALQELAAAAANPPPAWDSSSPISATSRMPSGDGSSPPSPSTPAAVQAANRFDGTSPSNRDAGRLPVSQAAAAQGPSGGQSGPANPSQPES